MASPAQSKRKRARIACEPCRERKRRCDGGNPCSTCTSWDYECHYARPQQPAKRRRPAEYEYDQTMASTSTPPTDVAPKTSAQPDPQGIVRSLEGNSGAAFVRKMGLKVDPANAPKLNLFGWNVGARQLPAGQNVAVSAMPVTEIISLADAQALAEVYFAKVDPCYGFIDRRRFFERLANRWQTPQAHGQGQQQQGHQSMHDSVICGVAALGSLFSNRSITITELHLVESARAALDSYTGNSPPSVDQISGWTLRVIYMRMTATPHLTWISSCTLMHLVEAAGLHRESSSLDSSSGSGNSTVLHPSTQCDLDIRRRIVGVAQHLNIWTSFDLGLSRVVPGPEPVVLLPEPSSDRPNDFTAEILSLLPVSASLDPLRPQTDSYLEAALAQTLAGTHTRPPSVLGQSNLVLCILRRLRTLNFNASPGITEGVLALLRKALQCARDMVTTCNPWHQVANVPFQIVCVLLEMDTCASLGMLKDAMLTVKMVLDTYDTGTMREAYSTACLLCSMYRRRREEDTRVLGEVLGLHQQQQKQTQQLQQQQQPGEGLNPAEFDEMSWLEGLVAEMPSLQGFEWDQFLQGDVFGADWGG